MWVVKLGGSLAGGPYLHDWLRMLASSGRGRVVIVPGGGPFAEDVRARQQRLGFDDRVAHNMAVLAMAQFATALHGMCNALVPATTLPAIVDALAKERVALWLPMEALRWEADSLASWDVTSDSLAAWLANQLSATRLALVKACAVPARRTPQEYADLGIVDARFPAFVRVARYDVNVVTAAQWPEVEAALNMI